MRLKSFYAKTMTEAMQMVRETLGEDAIIVATREENGGRAVRVTAATDSPTFERPPRSREDGPAFELGRGEVPADANDWLQYDEEELESAVSEAITEIMLKHSVPEDVTDQILSCATVMGLEEPRIALVAALEHMYGFRPLPEKPYKKALMMVGPPGAGKTLAAAKLAARGVMNGLNMAVISTDTVRAGGIEQLSAFTRLMKIDLLKARNPDELRACLDKARDNQAEQIIIDTGGLNPFDPSEVKELARLSAIGGIEPVLVLPAGADATESGEMARVFATLGVNRMLTTRLDIARRLGGLLEAAYQAGLNFAEISNTPQVAGGLTPLDPKALCNLLMPRRKDKARTGSKVKSG